MIFIWMLAQKRLGEPVKDMVGSATRLLLIRPSSVTLLDFWEGNSPSRSNMATKEKKSDSGPKATISEVGGKRRRLMGRESTKGKRRCCSFC